MTRAVLQQITHHVHWLAPDERTDRPVLGAVVGDHGSLIVDAGNSPIHAQQLLASLSHLPDLLIKYLVITHWHWDHVFGASAFDAPMFAHEETTRHIAEMAHWDWSDEALDMRVQEGIEIAFCRDMIKAEWPNPRRLNIRVPDVSFTTGLDFNLGGVTCQVRHVGGDHSADSSVVYIPTDRVLFLGDCLSPDLHHGADNYTTDRLIRLIDALLEFDADHILYGHSEESATRAEFADFAGLMQSIGRTVARLGDDRPGIIRALSLAMDAKLDETHVEIVDALLVGLRSRDAPGRAR
jgi:glyoxylase-like metal-dependent hydrolase (beta-lactamase superfamily II)